MEPHSTTVQELERRENKPGRCPFGFGRANGPVLPVTSTPPAPAPGDIHWDALDEELIAGLDPLGADAVMRVLPELNARADVQGLVAMLGSILPTEHQIQSWTVPECAAALRDLGMFLGSLRRHGTEPVPEVPGLEARLVQLGQRTGMVPRDTIFHYGPWNPRGDRQRMYTGTPDEDSLIACVRTSVPGLRSAVEALMEMQGRSPVEEAYASACERAGEGLRTLVEIIQFVRKEVDVSFFARELRPYFEGVEVGGRSYLGPAAAHVPLWLVDHFVWASDCDDAELRTFFEEAATHCTPDLRHFYRSTLGRPSLLTLLTERRPMVESPVARRSAEALLQVLRLMLTFRGKHRVVADQAYAPQLRLFATGSGGHTLDLLDRSLDITLMRTNLLRAWRESGIRRT